MAEQNRKQTGRGGPRRSDAPSDPYGLGLNMGLLDWTQLEPLGDAEAMAAAGQDLDFLPDLANELLDEGDSLIRFHSFYNVAIYRRPLYRAAEKAAWQSCTTLPRVWFTAIRGVVLRVNITRCCSWRMA